MQLSLGSLNTHGAKLPQWDKTLPGSNEDKKAHYNNAQDTSGYFKQNDEHTPRANTALKTTHGW